MKVSTLTDIPLHQARNILIRGTNWIGDAVMTLPAVGAIRNAFPEAKISVLAKPWVAEIYRLSPAVDEIVIFQSPGAHSGILGKIRLAKQLRRMKFDMAILLQNAIEAAIITLMAGIPIRAGYNSDGRGFLLTHSVRRSKAIRKVHQRDYYLEMVKSLGCHPEEINIFLKSGRDYEELAVKQLDELGIDSKEVLVGIAPGATYGPAKRWFPERFAAVSDRIIDNHFARVIIFGSSEDRETAEEVQKHAKNRLINLAGKTNLKQTVALMGLCRLFISNDSGLMHVAGALNISTVALFGSTNPVTTSPAGENSVVVYKNVSCSPCLQQRCPTDFRCMDAITVDDVYNMATWLLNGA